MRTLTAAWMFLAAAMLGCGPAASQKPVSGPPSVARLDFAGLSDIDALRRAAAHMRTLGWQVEEDAANNQVVLTNPKGRKFGLRATMEGGETLDRLVLFKAFRLKREGTDPAKVAEMVARLNNDITGVVYQTSTDGALVSSLWIYFVDLLDAKVLPAAADFLEEVTVPLIAAKVPELVKLLE